MAATARLELRIDPEAKELIEQAAAAADLSLTDFARNAVLDAAHATLRRSEHVTVVSAEYFDRLLAWLDAPPVTNENVIRSARLAKEVFSDK